MNKEKREKELQDKIRKEEEKQENQKLILKIKMMKQRKKQNYLID